MRAQTSAHPAVDKESKHQTQPALLGYVDGLACRGIAKRF
jgi:hypothetical protein